MAKIRETKIYQIFGCITLWKTVHVWEEAGNVSALCPIKKPKATAKRVSKKPTTKKASREQK